MTTYAWTEGGLRRMTEPGGQLRVADSWRQADGAVRRLDLHRERFVGSVESCAPGVPAGAFFDAAAAAVPGDGEWFPRVRLMDEELYLDVRPGPPRSPSAVVHVLPPGDPRRNPRVKGPDMALAEQLITQAREQGADEVLYRDEAGLVLEAGYASLVWWDGDDLCVPSRGLPVLPGVTRTVVEEQARALGMTVRGAEATIDDLDGREAWLLNAYQGLRLVTAWVGSEVAPGEGVRFGTWRAALEEA